MKIRFKCLSIFLFITSLTANAKLLDKIFAVVDNNIVTLSYIERVESGLTARRNLAPQIYGQDKYTREELIKKIVRNYLIKSKLSEMNYNVVDEQVEQQIKSTEDRLGLSRQKLLAFLSSNNITFDEYFELIRESIEYSIFYQRIVTPLVSITEQEIKNTFYRINSKNKTLSFKYGLIDYIFNPKSYSESKVQDTINYLKKNDGKLDDSKKDVETSELGDITEEGVNKELKDVLKNTDEGSYSRPVHMGGSIHVFFVKQKDLVESEVYLRAKNNIREGLFNKQALEIIEVWHTREENRHYVKYF